MAELAHQRVAHPLADVGGAAGQQRGEGAAGGGEALGQLVEQRGHAGVGLGQAALERGEGVEGVLGGAGRGRVEEGGDGVGVGRRQPGEGTAGAAAREREFAQQGLGAGGGERGGQRIAGGGPALTKQVRGAGAGGVIQGIEGIGERAAGGLGHLGEHLIEPGVELAVGVAERGELGDEVVGDVERAVERVAEAAHPRQHAAERVAELARGHRGIQPLQRAVYGVGQRLEQRGGTELFQLADQRGMGLRGRLQHGGDVELTAEALAGVGQRAVGLFQPLGGAEGGQAVAHRAIGLGQQGLQRRARRQREQAFARLLGQGLDLQQQLDRAAVELDLELDHQRVGERHQRLRQHAHGPADQLGAGSGQRGRVDRAQHALELADGADDLVGDRGEGDARQGFGELLDLLEERDEVGDLALLGKVGDRLEDLAQRFGQRFGVDGVHRRIGRLQGLAERRGGGRQRARERGFEGGDRLLQRGFELLLQAGEVERLDLAAGVAEGAFGAGAEAGELLLDGGDRVAGGVEGVGDRGADRADVEQLEHRLQAAAHVLDELGERLERVGRQGRHGEAADALGKVGEGGARLQQHQRAAQAGVERAGEFD